MSVALKRIDSLLSTLNDDGKHNASNVKQINLSNPLFKNKRFRILICGLGYPYASDRLSKLHELGYSNITLLPQCASAKEAEQALYEHIVTQQNNQYDGIINCWIGIAKSINDEINLPNCKVISCVSAGFKEKDLVFCKRNGISLTNASMALNKATSDLVVGLMIATCKQFFNRTKILRSGQLDKQKKTLFHQCGDANNPTQYPLSKDLYGSVVGIVGLGNIGKEISKRLHFGFDCTVIYFNGADKKRKEYDTEYGAIHCDSFDKLLKMSDFVVAMCPLNESTKHLFDKNAFEKMKNDAIFINASRGSVCNTDDLVNALKTGQILAAGLDVTDPEPLPTNHELWTLDNCTILPHIGSATVATRQRMMNMAIDNTLRVLNGIPCKNIVYSPTK